MINPTRNFFLNDFLAIFIFNDLLSVKNFELVYQFIKNGGKFEFK